MANLVPLVSENLGMELAPIEHVDDGRRHRVRVGEAVAVDIEDVVSPFDPEGPPPKIMTVPVFMAMWTTMIVAMMFPAVAPIVLTHRLVTRRRGEGLAPTFAFGASYLVVWSLVGLVPLAVLIGFRQVTHDSAWLDRAGGLVLLLAGLYQFSRWKTTCLR